MKKGFLLTGILLWAFILILITGIILVSAKGGFSDMFTSNVLVKEETLSVSDAKIIDIQSTHYKIEVQKTAGSEVIVSQYGRNNTADDELFTASRENGALSIILKPDWRLQLFSFNITEEKLVVSVPAEWNGHVTVKNNSGGIVLSDGFTWQDVSLTTSSGGVRTYGDMNVQSLVMETSSGGVHTDGHITAENKVSLKTSSGGISCKGKVIAEDFSAKTTSGGIHSTEKIEAKTVTLSTSSGGIGLTEAVTDTFDFKTTSGGITADRLSGGGSLKTSSGGIKAGLTDASSDIQMKTSSGGIRITLLNEFPFLFEGNTGSGGIRGDIPMEKSDSGNHATAKVGENPSVTIKAETSSGGIRVTK